MIDVDCLFCKLIRGELPAHRVGETEHAFAFLDITPHAPGHTMVIPKKHVASLGELSSASVGPLFDLVQRVARRLEEVLHPDGLTIGINQGMASGQSITHLHVHLLPRFSNDNGGSVHSVVMNPPKETLEEMVEKIKLK